MTIVYGILGFLLLAAASGALYYFFVYDRGSVYERALQTARQGNYVDARALIRTRIDRDPDDPVAHFYMSRIYALETNDQQELEHLKEVKRIGRYVGNLKPNEIIGRIAQINYNQGRYYGSFENYLDVLQYDPSNELALAHVAFMAIGQEEFQVAERYFKRLVKVAPDRAQYHVGRGVALAMLRQKEALQSFNTALSLAPRSQVAQFLTALQAFRDGNGAQARELVESFLPELEDPSVQYMGNRLAAGAYYLLGEYQKALQAGEQCMAIAAREGWEKEEYDARLTIAYMAMLVHDLEKANEHLLELEIRNPADELVMKVSDFRMDLEEQVASLDQISPRGFDFMSHMQDWVRNRFHDDAIFKMSGLGMEESFDILNFFTGEGEVRQDRPKDSDLDPGEIIGKFNSLKGDAFEAACIKIMTILGFKMKKSLQYRDRDGADYLAASVEDKKITALFRIRQWSNQPISDIFLREQQNYMNEQKANKGFIIAGTQLTSGAEAALNNLSKITVINEMQLAELLQRIL